MPTTKASPFVALALAFCASAFSWPAAAVTTGDNGTHDPSRMAESDGKFWVYSTGGGSKWSTDGLAWTRGPAIFPNGFPEWVKSKYPTNQGAWAPDIIHLNGQYYLYYSVAGLPKKSCGIGLVTSPTLNPDSPDFRWTDRGLVVSNDEVVKYAAIDPGPIVDADGNLWVVWGGGYSNPNEAQSIWVTRLDNETGLPSAADPAKPGHPLLLGHKEGPYLHYHGSYYYLFWQTGSCCSGTDSTYTIHMARSKSITGPFNDDKVFYKTHDNVHGPGHIGIYNACGVERFTYHYYPSNGSILGENSLTWEDDWPVAGPEATTPLVPCAGGGAPSAGAGSGGGSSNSAGTSAGGGSTSDSAGTTSSSGTTSDSAGTTSSGGSTPGVVPMAGSPAMPSAGSSGLNDTPEADPDGEVGCACRLEAKSRSGAGAFGFALALTLATGLRRRRRAGA